LSVSRRAFVDAMTFVFVVMHHYRSNIILERPSAHRMGPEAATILPCCASSPAPRRRLHIRSTVTMLRCIAVDSTFRRPLKAKLFSRAYGASINI